MNKETVGYFQIIIASFLFGFIPILVRLGGNISAYNLSFFRVLVAVICLGLIFLFFKRFKLSPFKREKGKLLVFGAIHGFIILGYFIAIQYLSVTSAVLLLYSSSIWMVVFSYFILNERISKFSLLALLISLIGLVFVLFPSNLNITKSFIGSLAGLGAGLGFGLVYVLSKTFKTYDKVSLTFWQNLIALPFLLPLLFIDFPHFTLYDSGIIILLGSLFTTLPFILVFKGFSKVPAHKGGIFVLLDIIFPIFFAWIAFGEIPILNQIIGAILIIIGSYLATK